MRKNEVLSWMLTALLWLCWSLQTGLNPEHLQAARKAQKKRKEKTNSNQSSPLKICAKVGRCFSFVYPNFELCQQVKYTLMWRSCVYIYNMFWCAALFLVQGWGSDSWSFVPEPRGGGSEERPVWRHTWQLRGGGLPWAFQHSPLHHPGLDVCNFHRLSGS